MNLYDFLYYSLKEGLFCNPLALVIIITLFIFLSLIFLFPYYLVCHIKSFNIKNFGIEVNTKALEKKSIFPFSKKKQEPSIIRNTNKQHKEKWWFSGAAYYLGKGTDERTYFIGYFGNGIPEKYETITVECETIVGADWDNTPQWKTAFEAVRSNYKLTIEDVPDYTGNSNRNNRNLYGIYACEKEWPNKKNNLQGEQ
jgi:hypothetical protein